MADSNYNSHTEGDMFKKECRISGLNLNCMASGCGHWVWDTDPVTAKEKVEKDAQKVGRQAKNVVDTEKDEEVIRKAIDKIEADHNNFKAENVAEGHCGLIRR